MVGAVGHFTLQLMGRTNHKFPGYGGPGVRKEAKSKVVVFWSLFFWGGGGL